METTTNGIKYIYDLSYDGGHFIIFTSGRTKEDINHAKTELRRQQDVVSLRLASVEDYIDLFKAEVFKDQRTRPLKWYEINDDPDTLKKAVAENWTVDYYVVNQVLPFVKRTKKENIKKYGKERINF